MAINVHQKTAQSKYNKRFIESFSMCKKNLPFLEKEIMDAILFYFFFT